MGERSTGAFARVRKFASCAICAFVTYAVLGHGLPSLRHDWRIPADASAFGPWVASFFEGWRPDGIGMAQPYPTFYLLGLAIWPFERVLDSYAVTLAIVAASMVLASEGAAAVARRLGATPTAQVALALFACLNPWVYSKFVAGHILMLFAYGVLLALLAETMRERPRIRRLIVLAALSITQIEFFLVAFPLFAIWAWRRKLAAPAIAMLLAAAPIAFGIVASYGDVRATPFNLTWQQSQSADLGAAIVLQGYVFDYARAFVPLLPVSIALAVLALGGFIGIQRDRRALVPAGVAVVALLFATGTKGPIGIPYTWLVLHVTEIGVFRELYDLIGVVAIGYVVLLARGAGTRTVPATVLLLAAASFAWPWVAAPPAAFAVDARAVRSAAVPARPDARVALVPEFQPMSFEGRGSGVDPDAYARSGFAAPVNVAFPAFPIDSALGFAALSGDERYLDALGVIAIVRRPYLESDARLLALERTASGSANLVDSPRTRPQMPLLTLDPRVPGLATIANDPGERAVFFGDRDPSAIATFPVDRRSIDATASWVDARLAFATHPEWGTAFGGVVTQSPNLLPLPRASVETSLLAQTDDRIVDDAGRTIARRSSALHWWPLFAGSRGVRCYGTCVVVLQGAVPRGLPEQGPQAVASAVIEPHFVTPWFGWAELPAGSSGTLRLNIGYAPAWAALCDAGFLRHERLDTALNAWAAPNRAPRSVAVYFIETVAFVQFGLELFAAIGICALIVVPWRPCYRAARKTAP